MKIKFITDKGACKKGHIDNYPEHLAKKLVLKGVAEEVDGKKVGSTAGEVKEVDKTSSKKSKKTKSLFSDKKLTKTEGDK